ncbi:MAG: PIN domain-containing protein [Planctomycetes bacterium]|nr:PIN domain-containing protein [Planctomycetota bacterium]
MSTSDSPIVAIDSMVLVWGIREDGDWEQIERAKWLFLELEEQGAQVLLPSVALAEYLTPVDVDKQGEVISTLNTRFIIPPFDVKCAALASRLFRQGKSRVKKGAKDSRRSLRADTLIIATAAVHGARVFYSNDKRCRKLVSDCVPRLEAKDLPTMAPNLFAQ